jgi:hypothetical protein
MNFVYLRSSRLHFFQIWALIHALATRERKKGGEKLHCMPRTYSSCQGGVCAFPLHFWSLGQVLFEKTCVTGFENWCDRIWSKLLKKTSWTSFGNLWDRFWLLSTHKSRGSVLWLRGTCICAGGVLLWVLPWLLWWFVLFAWACFLSRLCWAIALA